MTDTRSIESDRRIVADFLDDGPGAVATVSRWARDVAEHRAWGFETPDDIVQSALLALVGNFRSGRWVDGDLRAYVRRIAKNLCVTSYRRKLTRGVELSIDARMSIFSTGADVYLAVASGSRKSVRLRSLRSSWL